MKKNVGKIDVIIRIVLAIVFIALYFTEIVTGTFGIILLVLAGISVATSLIKTCPLYSILGLSTCPLKKK